MGIHKIRDRRSEAKDTVYPSSLCLFIRGADHRRRPAVTAFAWEAKSLHLRCDAVRALSSHIAGLFGDLPLPRPSDDIQYRLCGLGGAIAASFHRDSSYRGRYPAYFPLPPPLLNWILVSRRRASSTGRPDASRPVVAYHYLSLPRELGYVVLTLAAPTF